MPTRTRLVLDLATFEPPEGVVVGPDGREHQFVGWLGFVWAIEKALKGEPTAAEPDG